MIFKQLDTEAQNRFFKVESDFHRNVREMKIIEIDSDSDDINSNGVSSREKRKATEQTEIVQTEKKHCVAGPSKVRGVRIYTWNQLVCPKTSNLFGQPASADYNR